VLAVLAGGVITYRPPGNTAVAPVGFKEWCERVGPDQGLKHGWYAEWYPDGRPSRSGAYEDGLRVGVWTRWYPNGRKRVQAEFKSGLQHGKLISWDKAGRKLGEQQFRNGTAHKPNGKPTK
jgi:antitoxin component YwqK of YwqJK toxin-antitoxin module